MARTTTKFTVPGWVAENSIYASPEAYPIALAPARTVLLCAAGVSTYLLGQRGRCRIVRLAG